MSAARLRRGLGEGLGVGQITGNLPLSADQRGRSLPDRPAYILLRRASPFRRALSPTERRSSTRVDRNAPFCEPLDLPAVLFQPFGGPFQWFGGPVTYVMEVHHGAA